VGEFKKLSCNAKQVVVDKISDGKLSITINDSNGDIHSLDVNVTIENIQNIDILGDKLEQYVDVPTLDVLHDVKKSKKYDSLEIDMKWNHKPKPSVYEIKKEKELLFSGSFTEAMKWVQQNVKEGDQKIVTKKSLH
jgi:hypothetical protein